MKDHTPDYDEVNDIEAQILKYRWAAIRFALDHSGEKGSAAEYEVVKLLRSFLPAEYGVTTGFIIYHKNDDFLAKNTAPEPKLTKQLDIIIYDALRCSPLISLGTCDVIPLEAVYAYVEIKGCLYKNQISNIVKDTSDLRSMRTRLYYRSTGSTHAKLKPTKHLPIRSFIVCLTTNESLDPKMIRYNLEKESRKIAKESFISGMLVFGSGFYYSHSVSAEIPSDETKRYKVYMKTKTPLNDFKWQMIESLSRFDRILNGDTPAIDTYSKAYRPDIDYTRASGTVSVP